MYTENSQFKPPDVNAKIWRYMSFDRYKDMLSSSCLYFCKGNKLNENDPYEGSYLSSELLKEVPKEVAVGFSNKMKSCGPPIRINCWHLNEFESVAMWKIYGDGDAVAVQSTYKRIVTALNKCPCDVRIGKVSYIVPGKESFRTKLSAFVPWLHKHRGFEYEHELRAVIWDTDGMPVLDDGSVLAPVDLVALIEKVYVSVSPTTSSDMKEKVEETNKAYGVEAPVFQSELKRIPAY